MHIAFKPWQYWEQTSDSWSSLITIEAPPHQARHRVNPQHSSKRNFSYESHQSIHKKPSETVANETNLVGSSSMRLKTKHLTTTRMPGQKINTTNHYSPQENWNSRDRLSCALLLFVVDMQFCAQYSHWEDSYLAKEWVTRSEKSLRNQAWSLLFVSRNWNGFIFWIDYMYQRWNEERKCLHDVPLLENLFCGLYHRLVHTGISDPVHLSYWIIWLRSLHWLDCWPPTFQTL